MAKATRRKAKPVAAPKAPRTWAKTKGVAQSAVVLAPLVGFCTFIYQNSDYVDWSIAFHASRNHHAVADVPTTEELAHGMLPQFMQASPPPAQPDTADIMRAAADNLPAPVRNSMRGVFQQAIAKIRQTRIRNAGQLSEFLRVNTQDSLGSNYAQGDQFLQVWDKLAKENASAGNFQNMGDVAQFCQGTLQVLQGQ